MPLRKSSSILPQDENLTPISGEFSNVAGADSPNLPQTATSQVVNNNTPNAHQNQQQAPNRHSASPVRVITSAAQSRRLSDSEVASGHQGIVSVL